MLKLKNFINDIPDFPKKGIIFKDISPLIQSPEAFSYTVDLIANFCFGKDINTVVGIEARGFIFSSALAYKLGWKLVLIRKKGKLPSATYSVKYDLEYGTDGLEIHQDALGKKDKVLLFDDVLATGGTIGAAINLVQQAPCQIKAIAFLIELSFLSGKTKINSYNFDILSLINY